MIKSKAREQFSLPGLFEFGFLSGQMPTSSIGRRSNQLHRPDEAPEDEQQIGNNHAGKLHTAAGQSRNSRAEILRKHHGHRDNKRNEESDQAWCAEAHGGYRSYCLG